MSKVAWSRQEPPESRMRLLPFAASYSHHGIVHPSSTVGIVRPRARSAVCVYDDLDQLSLPSLDRSTFLIGTIEPNDLPNCVSVLMDGFYKDILTLAKDEFTEEEMETCACVPACAACRASRPNA